MIRRAFGVCAMALAALGAGGCRAFLSHETPDLAMRFDGFAVEHTTRGAVLGSQSPEYARRPFEFLRIEFSGKVNLFDYMERHARLLQVECPVIGAADGRHYHGTDIGLILDGVNLNDIGPDTVAMARALPPSADGLYHYTLQALYDLEALDDKLVDGKPRGYIDLKSATFDKVGCFVIGAQMAPVRFPRTNTLWITRAQLLAAAARPGSTFPASAP